MIPVHLSLSGLYSYRQKQEIDFRKLTSSQLFGIFGPIGCGKSSILEAIMFALFERSDRLKTSGDNRYYNMLNLQSDEMEIDFTFTTEANTGEYRVYFKASRNRNNYEDVRVRSRVVYKKEAGTWIPLDNTSAAEILGMKYENFMQTVIIPQGKFREFVDQKASERTQMLKELFRLERYELGHKASILYARTREAINNIEGQLSQIGIISEDEISQAGAEVEAWQEAQQKNRQHLKDAETACQQQEVLRKLFEDLQKTREALRREEDRKEWFDKKAQRLQDYQRALTFFNEKLASLVDTRRQITHLKAGHSKRLEEVSRQEKALEEASQKLKEKQQTYQQREQKEQQCRDLEHIIRIKELESALLEQQNRSQSAVQQHQQLHQAAQTLKDTIAGKEEHLNRLDGKLKRRSELQQLAHWYDKLSSIHDDKNSGQQEYERQQARMADILERKQHLLQPYEWARQNGSFEKCKTLLKAEQQNCRQKQEALQQKLQELRLSEKLSAYAVALKDGGKCPLCGSTDHPELLHVESVNAQISSEEAQLKSCRQQQDDLQQLSEEINRLEADHNNCQQTIREIAERQKQQVERLKQHQEAFCWEDFREFTADQINDFLEKLENMSKEADKLRSQLQLNRQKVRQVEEQEQQAQKARDEARQKEIEINAGISHHRQELSVLPFEKYRQYELNRLQKSLQKGLQQVKEAQKAYEEAQDYHRQLENQLSTLRGRLEADRDNLRDMEKRAEDLEKELHQLCTEKNFSSLDDVRNLLELELDVEAEQDEINLFRTRLASCREQVEKLSAEAAGKQYHPEAHRAMLQTLEEARQASEDSHKNLVLAQKHLQGLSEKRQQSRDLQQALEKQQRRLDNLNELRNLFRGSGFVRYVSTVYLENLCRSANERFMKLTRNNLSMELNEEGEFIVRDYLNNGKTRLLKTLSGGQTFQAALCLALALAENVKSINRAEQSFFFLDEGFGALDREALRVVFETLKSLRKERRIVGIISHVEELQQEIDVFLRVENDKERGSLISCSWE